MTIATHVNILKLKMLNMSIKIQSSLFFNKNFGELTNYKVDMQQFFHKHYYMYLINSRLNYYFWIDLIWWLRSKFLLNLRQNIGNIYLFDHLVRQKIINIYCCIIWWPQNQSFPSNFWFPKCSFVNFGLFKSSKLTTYMFKVTQSCEYSNKRKYVALVFCP
jgi:hypothetical protein